LLKESAFRSESYTDRAESSADSGSHSPSQQHFQWIEVPTASRVWTHIDGRIVLGRVMEIDEDEEMVVIRTAKGESFENYPIKNLIIEDRAFLRGLK